MTRKHCLHKKKAGFLVFSFRQHWPLLVAMCVLLMLALTVPSLMFAAGFRASAYTDETESHQEQYLGLMRAFESFYLPDVIVGWVFIGLLAVLCGIVTVRFLNKKEGVNYWHSVPVRRETLLLTDMTVCATYALVAYTVSTFLGDVAALAPLTKYLTHGETAGIVGKMAGYYCNGLLIFVMAYAIMIFAAMLSGTDVMRVLMGAVIIFLPIGLFLAVIGLWSEFSDYTVWESLLSSPTVYYVLLPLSRPLLHLEDPMKWYDVALLLGYAALLLGASFLLYRNRRSESAGTPLIHKPVAAVILYCGMFLSAILTGFVFEFMGDGGWMIVGWTIGMTLAFMLINAVLLKSPKSMFKKPLRLVAFAAAFAVFVILLAVDPLRLDGSMPTAFSEEAVISFSGERELSFRGEAAKKVLASFDDLVEKSEENRDDSQRTVQMLTILSNGTEYSFSNVLCRMVNVTVEGTYVGNVKLGKNVYTKGEIAEAWLGQFDRDEGRSVQLMRKAETGTYYDVTIAWKSISMDTKTGASLLRTMASSVPAGSSEANPVIGRISVYDNEWSTMDLYASDWEAVREALPEIGKRYESWLEIAAEKIKRIVVVDWETMTYVEYTEKSGLSDALTHVGSFSDSEFPAGDRYVAYLIDDQWSRFYSSNVLSPETLPGGVWKEPGVKSEGTTFDD